MTNIEKVLAYARKEALVPVKENPLGSNRGVRVNEYQEFCHLGKKGGFFWCACFTSYVGHNAIDNFPVPASASCDVILNFARKNKVLYSTPKVGDLFLIMRNDNDAYHIGFVSGVDGNKLTTIEGNAGSDFNNTNNGDGVYIKTSRRVNSKIKFVRWADLLDEIDEDEIEPKPFVVVVGAVKLSTMYTDGRVFVPLRSFMESLYGKDTTKKDLGFDSDTKKPTWKGEVFPSEILFKNEDGSLYVALRTIVNFVGVKMDIDDKNKVITLNH